MTENSGVRLRRMVLTEKDVFILHNKNPWMPMWWSAALPGLGHLCEGAYIKGLLLMFWEILINFAANLNQAILYTFTGQFARAREVVDPGWALFYGVIFCFAVYDSYRLSIKVNILARLERRQPRRHYQFMRMSASGLNFLDRSNPWAALAWSLLLAGFGHLYNIRFYKAIILLAWSVAIIKFSNMSEAVIATFNGQFQRAGELIDYQWLMFFPSVYLFAAWDAYNDAVEKNKLFADAQKHYLKKTYGLKGEPACDH